MAADQQLEYQQQNCTTTTDNTASDDDRAEAAVLIQKTVRGHITRQRVKRLKLKGFTANELTYTSYALTNARPKRKVPQMNAWHGEKHREDFIIHPMGYLLANQAKICGSKDVSEFIAESSTPTERLLCQVLMYLPVAKFWKAEAINKIEEGAVCWNAGRY
eukprot:TRINITY_DN24933_c0_g1_i1.p1 TRINITY_DN24933_c0_g1~~TRINITY_DN24933_c0_g1_i1.p1  ORF type:complete len:161 (-),score=16.77 TRINITY_DN24933_c0_g1_i1:11-493(-)